MASLLRNRIKVARIYAGLTQEELGKLCEVTKSAVSCWETGNKKKSTEPTLVNLRAIAKATGAPIAWLVDDDEDIIGEQWRRYESAEYL